jgi:phage shock protein PspC (stress-responsive transcriptional regulator)
VVAGVCGGLGRATNIDPVIFRVLVVVLAFFGGAGLLLYALGWLLLPEEDTGISLLERALGRGRGRNRANALALAVVLIIVTMCAVAAVAHDWAATVLILLVAAGAFLLLRRDGQAPYPGGWPPVAAPRGPAPETGGPQSAPNRPGPTGVGEAPGTQSAPGFTDDVAEPTVPITETTPAGTADPSYPAPPAGPPPSPPYAEYGGPPYPSASPPPKAPHILWGLTLSALLVTLGTLAIVDAAGAHVAIAAYPALALAVIGVGLLVGTWYGRSRGLILLGVLAALALGPTAVADRVGNGDFGNDHVQLVTPLSVAAIQPAYTFRPGRAVLDLTGDSFTSSPVQTTLNMPVGRLQVRVPANVDVITNLHLGAGEATILGRHSSGAGIDDRVEDLGADGRGGGQLTLTVDQGLGSVDVTRGGVS